MGLAASQGRLLLLTARKDDVESQLMSIANQKLSLSRQSAEVAENYNNSLNAVKLTWTGDNGTDVDLTYDLLMRPNTTNDANQYLITDTSNGKVILDPGYINKLGIGQAGDKGQIANLSYSVGGQTYTGEKAFIMELIGCSSDDADKYIKASEKSGGKSNSNLAFTTEYSDSDVISNSIGLGTYGGTTTLGSDSDSSGCWGGASSSVDPATIADQFGTLLKTVSSSVGTELKKTIEGTLGSSIDSGLNDALEYAYQATYNKFVNNINDTDATDGVAMGSSPSFEDSKDPTNQNRICYHTDNDSGCLGFNSSSNTKVTVDNSQVIDTYLTYFDQYCAQEFGGTNSSSVGDSTTTRGATGGTGSSNSKIGTGATVGTGDKDVNNNGVNDAYEGGFYITLYNAILNKGWETNSNIDNKSYLQNQVLYGNVTIDELDSSSYDSSSNTFKQDWEPISTSDSSSPLGETTDQDAVAKAEAQYQSDKTLLDYKESQLDVKTNDLDTERSAITTEIESVNSIIKKNIDSSFKMFDSSA